MTYDQPPHLMRDAVYDAKQEGLLIQNGINPRIAKAVVSQTRMQYLKQLNKQANDRSNDDASKDSTD